MPRIDAMTKEEKKRRENLVTSSVIYDVIHAPHRAWRRIKGIDSFEVNDLTVIGNALEDPVRNVAAYKLGYESYKPGFAQRDDAPWAGDSCDAVFTKDGAAVALGEIKTHGEFGTGRSYDLHNDQVPDHIYTQAQWHLWHYPDVDVCYVCPLLGGWSLSVATVPVYANSEVQKFLIAAGHQFWQKYIATKDAEPPADGEKDTAQWLADRIPHPNGETVEADNEARDLISEYASLTSASAEIERRRAAIKNRLTQLLGANTGMTIDEKTVVRVSEYVRKGYTVGEKTIRQLRITAPKGD